MRSLDPEEDWRARGYYIYIEIVMMEKGSGYPLWHGHLNEAIHYHKETAVCFQSMISGPRLWVRLIWVRLICKSIQYILSLWRADTDAVTRPRGGLACARLLYIYWNRDDGEREWVSIMAWTSEWSNTLSQGNCSVLYRASQITDAWLRKEWVIIWSQPNTDVSLISSLTTLFSTSPCQTLVISPCFYPKLGISSLYSHILNSCISAKYGNKVEKSWALCIPVVGISHVQTRFHMM